MTPVLNYHLKFKHHVSGTKYAYYNAENPVIKHHRQRWYVVIDIIIDQ